MFVGIGLIGVLTATVASYFVEQSNDNERAELLVRLERIETLLTHLAGAPAGEHSSPAAELAVSEPES